MRPSSRPARLSHQVIERISIGGEAAACTADASPSSRRISIRARVDHVGLGSRCSVARRSKTMDVEALAVEQGRQREPDGAGADDCDVDVRSRVGGYGMGVVGRGLMKRLLREGTGLSVRLTVLSSFSRAEVESGPANGFRRGGLRSSGVRGGLDAGAFGVEKGGTQEKSRKACPAWLGARTAHFDGDVRYFCLS